VPVVFQFEMRTFFEYVPRETMKLFSLLAMLAFATSTFALDPKETMCVKQKNGTYRCKASGKIEKKPCCDTPSNDPKPKHKK
jgi:hypothetical protein